MITSELYEQYKANNYKIIFARGYTGGNSDYREAKKPVSKWKDQKNTKPLPVVAEWLNGGGWISVVLPTEVFALDIDNKEHYHYDGHKMTAENPQGLEWKMQMLAEIADGLEYGRHKTQNGYHVVFAASGDYSASSKVYTKCGMATTYRPGGKTNLVIAPSNGRSWEKFVPNDQLSPLPEALQPLNFADQKELRRAIAFQIGFFWRAGVLSGNDDIDFAFMDLLVRDRGYSKKDVLEVFEGIYGPQFDSDKTTYNYNHSRDREKVISAATFYKRLHTAKLYDLIDLVNNLPAIRSDGSLEKTDNKKNINTLAIEYAANYAKRHNIISAGAGDLYQRKGGWCYEEISDKKMRQDFTVWLGDRYRTKIVTEMIEFVRDANHMDIKPGFSEFLMADDKVFSTHTMTLREPTTNDFFFHRLNVAWRPEAECPRWISFLREVFPDYSEDHIDFLQQFIGYIFYPQNRFELSLILRGEGANGKSVLMDTIEHLVGRANISAVGLAELKNPMYIHQLQGKLLNMCSELDTKIKMSDGIFKSLVSGENVTSKELYKNPTLIRPFCKFIYSSNNPVSVSDKSDGYERRVVYLNFTVSFKGAKEDLDLRKKLIAEADGIFKWAMQGLQRILRTGQLTVPVSLREISRKEHKKTNSVWGFCAEHLFWTRHNCEVVALQKIYDEYKKFCAMNNLPVYSYEAFVRMILNNVPSLRNVKFKSQAISKLCHVKLKQVPYDSLNRCYNEMYEENIDPLAYQPVTAISLEEFQRRFEDENNPV